MTARVTPTLLKYPRTRHLAGSTLQSGDEDLDVVTLDQLNCSDLVIEEKLDGANSAISFDEHGEIWIQSRGHYLTGGPRERQFTLLKSWAAAHQHTLLDLLEDRYLLYGEFCQCKHTVFYDALPHYFLEFDIYDRQDGVFLATDERHQLLAGSPVVSVPVIYRGRLSSTEQLDGLVTNSLYKTDRWRERLAEQAQLAGVDPARALAETDDSDLAEGLYVKREEDGQVTGRYKWVRAGFLQAIADSDSHWQSRPIIPNLLADGTDIYAS